MHLEYLYITQSYFARGQLPFDYGSLSCCKNLRDLRIRDTEIPEFETWSCSMENTLERLEITGCKHGMKTIENFSRLSYLLIDSVKINNKQHIRHLPNLMTLIINVNMEDFDDYDHVILKDLPRLESCSVTVDEDEKIYDQHAMSGIEEGLLL